MNLPKAVALILCGLLPFAARAAFTFNGTWSCSGTLMTIDDDEPRQCTMAPLNILQTTTEFKVDARVACPDGTNAGFAESDPLKGQAAVDSSGQVIGQITATSFTTTLHDIKNKMDLTTTMTLTNVGKQLHVQRDSISDGVPLLEEVFDCGPM
jgi:hypothetical protein